MPAIPTPFACDNVCASPSAPVTTPGPQGEQGEPGTNGEDGIDAVTAVTTYDPPPQPVMPAEGADQDVNTTASTSFLPLGGIVYVENWGWMGVVAVPDDDTVTLRNLYNSGTGAYSGNAIAGTSLPGASKIMVSGPEGPAGPAVGGALLSVNNLNDVADPVASAANLGLLSMAFQGAASVAITGGSIVGITPLAVADGGTGAANAPTARQNLDVEIGVDVQAFDAGLQSLSAFPTVADRIAYSTAVNVWAETTLTPFARGLLDDADADAMRATIGATANDMLLFRHETAAGSSGGNFAPASTWNTVPLNTEVVDTGNHGSIAANQITLAAGTYRYRFGVVTYGLDDQFQGRLFNVTTGLIIANSYSQVANSRITNSPVVGVSNGSGLFTLAGVTTIRLEAQSPAFRNADGFGIASSLVTDPSNEVYSWIELIRQ